MSEAGSRINQRRWRQGAGGKKKQNRRGQRQGCMRYEAPGGKGHEARNRRGHRRWRHERMEAGDNALFD